MYRINFFPFIETLDDLAQNQMAKIYLLDTFVYKINETDSKLFEKLEKRVKDQRVKDQTNASKIFKSVENGQAVILGNEVDLLNIFSRIKNLHLYISPVKYFYEPLFQIIGRKHENYHQILARLELYFYRQLI